MFNEGAINNYEFILEIVRDRNTAYEKSSERLFDNAVDAVQAFNNIMDYGFAAYQLDVILTEPDGKQHFKTYYGHGSGKPVVFSEKTIRYQVV